MKISDSFIWYFIKYQTRKILNWLFSTTQFIVGFTAGTFYMLVLDVFK